MRSCARRRQWKGAIAAGQWRYNARRVTGHGSVMSAEKTGFLKELRIIESMSGADREGRNGERRAKVLYTRLYMSVI